MGLPFYSGNTFTKSPFAKNEDIFGGEFAKVIDALDEGRWIGPIQSAFGYHNVMISSIENSEVPSFNSVKNTVLADYLKLTLIKPSKNSWSKLNQSTQWRLAQTLTFK